MVSEVIRLTDRGHWLKQWGEICLPHLSRPGAETARILDKSLPSSPRLQLVELGCVPGGWLAYFWKEFGYQVFGVDYLAEGVKVTRHNLELLGVPGTNNIFCLDVFSEEVEKLGIFDIVFSAGFVEHFDDLDAVIARAGLLARQYVVTTVPNFCGINGAIRKVFRPRVFDTHRAISPDDLRRAHERADLKVLFCDYVDGIQVTPVAGLGRAFFEDRPRLSNIVNLPIRVFNRISGTISRTLEWFPRTSLAPSVLCLGQRQSAATAGKDHEV